MRCTLHHGALAGIPARLVAFGPEVETLGEPDQIVTIAFEAAHTLTGRRISRLDVCASELRLIDGLPSEFAA